MNAPHRTRSFKSGNSEAVRLPKGVGFGVGTEFAVERRDGKVVLTPLRDPAEAKRELLEMLADMEAIGAPPDGVQKREPIEFPIRPGLYRADEE